MLLAAGLWIYLSATTATSAVGKYAMFVFVVILLLLNIANVFGPLMDDSKVGLAVSALVSYGLFAGVAHWLDGKRT